MASALGATAAPALWAFVVRSGDDGPPAIRYGRDRCDACGMIISAPRFAAAARQGTVTHRYDDIGCLARDVGSLASGRATGFVHDMGSEGWIEAARAWFVQSPRIHTPMNYGIGAYADPSAARASVPGVPVLSVEQLLAALTRERS